MAKLANLLAAQTKLGLKVDSRFLQALKNNPDAVTEREIVRVFREKEYLITKADLENLHLIVTEANKLEAEPKTEPDVKPVPDPEKVEPIEVDKEEKGESELEEVVPSTAVPEKPSMSLNPEDYQEVEVIIDEESLTTLVIEDASEGLKVSWKLNTKSGLVFLLAEGNSEEIRTPEQAERSIVTSGTSAIVQAGYRTFSLFGFDAPNTKGRLVARGRVLTDVTSIEAESYEDQIRLMWTGGDSAAGVALYRSKPNKPLPENPPASLRIKIPRTAKSFIDTDIEPGQEFEYRVVVEWEGPNGQLVSTQGKRIPVVVKGSVPRVKGFSVTRSDDTAQTVDIEFDAPERGAVRVFQVLGHPRAELLRAKVSSTEFLADRFMDPEIREWLGTEVIDPQKSSDGKVRIQRAPMLSGGLDARTYIAVGTLGKTALISGISVIQQVGSIDEAEMIDRLDYQLLRVALPAGAQSLEVWLKVQSASQDVSSADLGKPDRTVQIEHEYRRFGGVLFANGVPGLPGLKVLQPDPLTIYIRGISTFEGVAHAGPLFRVNYPGRVAVHFRASKKAGGQAEGPGRGISGIFRRDDGASLGSKPSILELKVDAPASADKFYLHHYAAPTYPLDATVKGSVNRPLIPVVPSKYTHWQSEGLLEPGGVVELRPDLQFRLSSAVPDAGGIPVFTVDNRVDAIELPPIAGAKGNASLRVVLIGAKQSGKTTYVQALLHFFEQQLSATFGAKLRPLLESDEIAIQRLEGMRRFVTSGRLPEATRSARPYMNQDPGAPKDPLDPTKSLEFEFFNGGDVPLSEIHMTDVAGEDMDTLETMKFYQNQIRKADLIIFLMDPLQLGDVRLILAGSPLPEQGTDPFDVLSNLIQVLKESPEECNPKQKVAITLSKFDSFESITEMSGNAMTGLIQKGMQLTRDPNTNAQYLYNSMDGIVLESEILGIMERLNITPFTSLVRNSFPADGARYFVVSSLGHSTHAESMDPAGITSYRISDPIRWALSASRSN
jgi:GTPase SAR1 family protein